MYIVNGIPGMVGQSSLMCQDQESIFIHKTAGFVAVEVTHLKYTNNKKSKSYISQQTLCWSSLPVASSGYAALVLRPSAGRQ